MNTTAPQPPKKLWFGFIRPELSLGLVVTLLFGSYALWATWQGDRSTLQQLVSQVGEIVKSQKEVNNLQTATSNQQALESHYIQEHTEAIGELKSAISKESDIVNTLQSHQMTDERLDAMQFDDINKNLAVLNNASQRNAPLRTPRGLP